MTIISPHLRQPEESLYDYKIRLCKNKDEYGLTWGDIAQLYYDHSDEQKSPDHFRKFWRYYSEGFDAAIVNSVTVDDALLELEQKKLEVQKERVKLQSTKLEVNKWIREQSRNELIQEEFVRAVEKLQKPSIPTMIRRPTTNDVAPILTLADQHYGKDFVLHGLLGEVLNEYNPEEFEKRMWYVLEKVVARLQRDRLTHLNIANLGDAIDGILRVSQLQKIRMGAIDQTMQYANFMAHWLGELSKYTRIDYFSVLGNHPETRILNSDRGEFDGENLERVINWFLQSMLKDNPNVTIHDCGNFVYRDFVGVKTLMLHGQYEKNLESSVRDYMLAYGHKIDLVFSGHLHHKHEKHLGINGELDVEFIQCPSFCGADEYSMRLKRASKAAVKLFTLERGQGVVDTYKIKLN